jgi:hypothetical protein
MAQGDVNHVRILLNQHADVHSTLRGLAIGSTEIEGAIKQHTRCPYFSTRPIRVDVGSRQYKWILDNILMWRAVDHHLRCARLYEHEYSGREWKLSGCVLFHVTFWEVMAAKPHRSAESLWRVGKLHSHRDLGRPEFVRNSACTVSIAAATTAKYSHLAGLCNS